MQVILLSALFAVCASTVVSGGPLGDRTFKIAAADIDLASEFDTAPDFNIDQIRRCPRDASGRPIGGTGTGIVPRECLTAGAVAPPGGTRNISSNPNPVAADFIPDPNYNAKSGFDTQSLMLAAHQEDIERALFEQAVQNFTIADWLEAGLNATDVALIAFMAKQEVDHKQAFANMLGTVTPQPCNYSWPFGPHNATGFLRYALFNTRLGESGTIGWIPLLDNRASGNIIIQGITTESRQEMIFRQYLGLFPMPVSFETAIPQAWHWTLLSQWISSCPESNVPLSWPILPQLRILTQPPIPFNPPYITHNSTNVSSAGDLIQVGWDRPGRVQGPYGQRTTSNATDLRPTHALIVSQLNATVVPLQNVNPRARRAAFVHPYAEVFPNADHPFGISNPIINETVFVALINNIGRNGQSLNLSFTPENLTLATQYVVAGPAFWFIS